MRHSIHTCALIIMFFLGTVLIQADSLTVKDSETTSSTASIDLVLTLKVSSINPENVDDSADAAAMLKRQLQCERAIWAMIEVQTRVYRSELIQLNTPMDRRVCNSIDGLSMMLDQGRRQAQKRFSIFEQDHFEDYFGYTDVLNRSNRLYKSHYSINRSHEVFNPKSISFPGP